MEASAQQSGEADTAWAQRVQRLESDLLAKVAARPQYEAPEDHRAGLGERPGQGGRRLDVEPRRQ